MNPREMCVEAVEADLWGIRLEIAEIRTTVDSIASSMAAMQTELSKLAALFKSRWPPDGSPYPLINTEASSAATLATPGALTIPISAGQNNSSEVATTPPVHLLGTTPAPLPVTVTVSVTEPVSLPMIVSTLPTGASAMALPTNHPLVPVVTLYGPVEPHLKNKQFFNTSNRNRKKFTPGRFTVQPRTCHSQTELYHLRTLDPSHRRRSRKDMHILKHEYDPPPKRPTRGNANWHHPTALRTRLFQTAVLGLRMTEWPITQTAENDGEGTIEIRAEANALKRTGVKCARAPKVASTLKSDGVKHARAPEVAAAPDFMVLRHIFEKYSARTKELTYYGILLASFLLSIELSGLINFSDIELGYLKSRIFSVGKIMHQIWDYF